MNIIPPRPVVLCVIDFTEGTEYLGTERYTSRDTDTYPDAYFDGVLRHPRITIGASFPLWREGQATRVSAVTELVINNVDGSFDHWLNCDWKGKAIRLYIAECFPEESPAFADFALMQSLTIDNLVPDGQTAIKISVLDLIGQLYAKQLTHAFQGAPNAELNGTAQMLPLGHVRFAPAVLYEHFTGVDLFIISDEFEYAGAGFQEIVAIYENGVERFFPTDVGANLVGFTKPTGTNSAGQWQLNLKGMRRLTAAGGAWVETLYQAVEWLLFDRAGIDPALVDLTTLSALPDEPIVWHNRQQHFTCGALLQSLLDSVNAVVYQRNDGLIAFASMDMGFAGNPHKGTPVFELSDQIDDITDVPDLAPGLSQSTMYDISYARKSQSTNAPGSLLQAELEREYLSITRTTPPDPLYYDSYERAPRPTLLKSAYNQAELDSLNYGQRRFFCRAQAVFSVAEFIASEFWQLWFLRHPRFGLSAGVKARLASATFDTRTLSLEATLWH